MELTKKTNYIIVRAISHNESVSCDFAIVKINRTFLEEILNRVQSFYKKEDGYAKYSISCTFDVSFYTLSEKSDKLNPYIDKIEFDWFYLHLNEGEEENEELDEMDFDKIDDSLSPERLVIEHDGWFHIEATGKFSDILYETVSINIKDL